MCIILSRSFAELPGEPVFGFASGCCGDSGMSRPGTEILPYIDWTLPRIPNLLFDERILPADLPNGGLPVLTTMQHHVSIITGPGGHGIGGGTGGRAGDVHFHDGNSQSVPPLESLSIISVLPDRTSLLMSLPRALYAAHDSVREDAPSPCLEGTRVAVLKEILTWSESANGERPPVYWLNGLAGIGKSTIAKTVADQVQEKGMLGATFFFSRSDKPLRDPGLVLPTLAFQLAQSDNTLMEAIGLILTPLLSINPHRGPLLIILDALDECEEKGAAEILQLMFAHIARIPFLRILITSRPQPHLSSVFDKVPNVTKTVLHDIDPSIVEHDIHFYISTKLAKIPKKFDLGMPTDWATEAEKNLLVQKSGKLFIYAATAIRFIGDDRVRDPQTHLRLILNTQSLQQAGATPYLQLDNLYMEVLRNSLSPFNHREILKRFQIVVGSIVLLREPLPLHSLANFVHHRAPLRYLRGPRIYHPSFLEFITDPSRCSMPEFVIVAVPEQELRHAIRCFELMAKHLKRDVAGISDPSLLNRDVEGFEEKVRAALSPEVQYACRYWTSHLSRVEVGEARIMEALEAFSMRSILWWFEAMSLLGSVSNAVSWIEEAHHWANISKSKAIVVRILSDSRRFILAHGEVIRASALHVYHSALPFTPHDTVLYKTYYEGGGDSIKVLQGVGSEWPQNLSILRGHSGLTRTLAFSPDGLLLASGSEDGTVRLWDPISATSIIKLGGHSGAVLAIAFSPDGLCLASGSGDTVQLWDPISGASIATLQGHSDWVTTIAFSPNGLHLASGSWDCTVQLWDPISGASNAKLEGHSDQVTTIAFSPDGLCLASGSADHTVQLWDPISGSSIAKLEGHSDQVMTIAFSPDGLCLASGSKDCAVQLWDAISGASIAKLEGHSDQVTTIAFSPDGLCLASGSGDHTVQLWDPFSGASIAKLEGHSHQVETVGFSPNAQCLASGSLDSTVQLWDTISGASIARLEGNSSVRKVAFSPNGLHLASGSGDGAVRLWDPMSSTSLKKLEGHSAWVAAIAFSPDGLCLASGSHDHTVRLWDSISGVSIATLEGHSGEVETVAFSPNGQCLASGSWDHTVQLWDPRSGTSIAKLEGHFDGVTSVAFSPNGLCLASGSKDHAVQLWDPISGASIAKLDGHSNQVTTIAFSPDGLFLASGSHDHTVQLWDPISSASIARLEGHFDWVTIIAFSPDGLCLASGSCDDTVQLWDLISCASIAKLEGHSDTVYNLKFSLDACTLVSSSEMETFIWDLTSQPPHHLASRSSLATPTHIVGLTPPTWSLDGYWIQGIQQEDAYARKICYVPHHILRANIVASNQPTHTWLAVGCRGGHVTILVVPHSLFPQHFIEDPVDTSLIPTVALPHSLLPNCETLLTDNDTPSMYGAPPLTSDGPILMNEEPPLGNHYPS
ncbi:hypothetical protein BS47DRAFT_1486132 [Hydnum rufescens UP504]|uniref:NACHT domain-containing protein n=1 Tax=Hydnum rufescens UP504 TaxID=1448309 RepID=A0A9P6AV94_9AGAM|nr:hypothetical protein BS47DRAFT_1486132 [Hydnum rufescens UP504]